MNPKKYNPRPITSFMEDELELDELKKEMQKEVRKQTRSKDETRNRNYMIFAIRIIIALIAFAITVGLYILVDDFLAYYQNQRFWSVNTAFLLTK